MRPKSEPAEQHVREILRATRKQHSAEKNIRIVLAGLREEYWIAELCRREGLAESLHYAWSRELLEAAEKRLARDMVRAATGDEVEMLRREAGASKEGIAEITLENCLLKKYERRWGRPRMRYTATEKLEIIRLVERSLLPVKRPLDKLTVSLKGKDIMHIRGAPITQGRKARSNAGTRT